MRRAHAKLAWKATAVQAKQHAGKSHVGSPLSSAWFANKHLKAASHQLKFACYTFWVRRKSNNLQHCIFQSHHHKVTRYIFWCIIWISRDRYKRSCECCYLDVKEPPHLSLTRSSCRHIWCRSPHYFTPQICCLKTCHSFDLTIFFEISDSPRQMFFSFFEIIEFIVVQFLKVRLTM